jgi:hypothetical protein
LRGQTSPQEYRSEQIADKNAFMQLELLKVILKLFNLYMHTLKSFQTNEADNHL